MMYLGLALIAGLTVLYASNLYYYEVLISEGNDLGLDPGHPYYEFIADQRSLLTRVYLIVSAIIFLLLMAFGLFLSHRIAGPLYHMTRVMRLVQHSEGDGARVHLSLASKLFKGVGPGPRQPHAHHAVQTSPRRLIIVDGALMQGALIARHFAK